MNTTPFLHFLQKHIWGESKSVLDRIVGGVLVELVGSELTEKNCVNSICNSFYPPPPPPVHD
jgi:hypothetical protein